MHTIQNILKISPAGAVLSDQYGSTAGISLEIMLGTAVTLEFDLRQENNDSSNILPSYPADKLLSGAYYCAFDTSCNYSASPLLLQFSGTSLIPANDRTIFSVTIPDSAVEKMISALAGRESLLMLCEIGGISTGGKADFAWHFPVTIRNRVFSGNGTPTVAGDPEYYTAVQVEAAISRPLLLEYSSDGKSWHPEFIAGDTLYRMRHGANGVPSAAIPLLYGEKGDKGDPAVMTTLTDTVNTEATLAIEGGKRYVFTQPLNSLTVTGVEDSGYESEIEFTCNGEVSLPSAGLKYIGIAPENISFETGISYIIKIRNRRVNIAEVN